MDSKQAQKLHQASVYFRTSLAASPLRGPKTSATLDYCRQLELRLHPQPGVRVGEVLTQALTSEAPKTKKHSLPTGGFKKRERTITIGKKLIPVTSITEAERKICGLGLPNTAAEIAAAIKAAYPENNYTEQRYISAAKALNRPAPKPTATEPSDEEE